MVSYRNKDIFKNSALRRLAGKKEPVSTDLPTAGDNVAPSPTSTSSALKDSAIRTPSYAGNTNRPAGNVSSLTALSKQASNSSPPLNSQPGQGQLSKTKPAAQQSWTEGKMIGGMNVGDFVSMAGSLGNAIAPNTAEGRVGKVAAGYALREQERVKNEPDKELKRRKTLAEIAKLKAPVYEKRTSLMKNYEDAVKGGFKGTLADWKSVGKKTAATQKPKSGFNMVDGKLMKGNWGADNKFTGQRLASPKERKDWNDQDNTDLNLTDQMKLKEDATQSISTSMGYLFDKDQNIWTDSEGNKLSAAQSQEVKAKVDRHQKLVTIQMNSGVSMGEANQNVTRLLQLESQAEVKNAYDNISAMDIDSQKAALGKLPKHLYDKVVGLIARKGEMEKKRWAELNRPNISPQTSLQAIENERGLDGRAKIDNPLFTTGPTAKKMGESILEMSDKILPTLKGFNEKIKKLPGFTSFDKRMTGQ